MAGRRFFIKIVFLKNSFAGNVGAKILRPTKYVLSAEKIDQSKFAISGTRLLVPTASEWPKLDTDDVSVVERKNGSRGIILLANLFAPTVA